MGGTGERLREERMRLGMKQEEFALLGGVNRNTQGSYEKGDRNPDSSYLTAISIAGADVLYIVTGERRAQSASGFNTSEVQLVEQFRSLPPDQQQAVSRIVGAMADSIGKSQK